jgi:peptide/nickel transport system substrate-binding protein
LSRIEGSPWNDVRVRKAANLAVDREGMKELLAGLMIPAEGFFPPGPPMVWQAELQVENRSSRSQEALEGSRLRPR